MVAAAETTKSGNVIDSHNVATYDMETVSQHSTEDDLWIAVDGSVYNITKFLKFHPGGKDIIVQNAGTDVSEGFSSEIIHSHSEKAWRILEKYKIGNLKGFSGKAASKGKTEAHFLSNLVDMNKAILPQILSLNPPSLYQKWLHGAHTEGSTIRLFKSEFFEAFSKWPWWYIFPMWIPVVLYQVLQDLTVGERISVILVSYCWGLFTWMFIEYIFHRYLFHLDTRSKWGNFYHFFAHGVHHLIPLDHQRLTFPPMFSVVLGFILNNIFYVIVPSRMFHSFFGGFATAYMLYDAMHFFFHHGTIFSNVRYLQWMKSRHLKHHYKSPNSNFGVSSPLFDIIFGTLD